MRNLWLLLLLLIYPAIWFLFYYVLTKYDKTNYEEDK